MRDEFHSREGHSSAGGDGDSASLLSENTSLHSWHRFAVSDTLDVTFYVLSFILLYSSCCFSANASTLAVNGVLRFNASAI